MFKRIIFLNLFFSAMNLFCADRGNPGTKLTIGVPMATPPSSYIQEGGESSSSSSGLSSNLGFGSGKGTRPSVLNSDVYKECKAECLLRGEECLNNCLCRECWRNSIGGSSLIDACNCVNPDITDKLHF